MSDTGLKTQTMGKLSARDVCVLMWFAKHAGPPEGEADPVLAGEPQVVGGLRLEVLQDIANLVLASTQQNTIRQKTNSQR